MFDTLKEHMQEFAADTLVKHVLPSIIMSEAGLIGNYLHYQGGHPVFSPKSVHALTAIAILLVNYAIHLWNYLKRMAVVQKPKA